MLQRTWVYRYLFKTLLFILFEMEVEFLDHM